MSQPEEGQTAGPREEVLFPEPDQASLAEADRFAAMIAARRRGEVSEEEFRRFRLNNGVYGIRGQTDIQMIRVKIPLGVLSARHAQVLAAVAEDFTPHGVGHVTTRQCVQFHWIPLERMPEVIRVLAEAGLTSREACGNTVRNVTACPLAGICPKEVLDVRPLARGYVRRFLRNPLTQNFPRKFKTSFSGCPADCAASGMHDIGAVAVTRPGPAGLERGFRVWVGGGLGAFPKAALLLEEFTPADRFLATAEAIMRVFDRFGNRDNLHQARLKFLVEKLGPQRFRELVLRERRLAAAVRPAVLAEAPPAVEAGPGAAAPLAPAPLTIGVPPLEPPWDESPWRDLDGDPAFRAWARANAFPQRQEGYAAAWITVPGGDLTADQFRLLARLARRYGEGFLRTSPTQDVLVPWVRVERLPELYEELADGGLGEPGARHVLNVTGCPGADTCNLAITHSHRLALELHRQLAARPEYGLADDLRGISIKVSGCANSCGQHHIATVGLHGAATRADGHQAPLYQLLLGGQVGEGLVAFGRPVLRLPAKRVPDGVFRLFDLFRAERRPGESFADWARRAVQQDDTGDEEADGAGGSSADGEAQAAAAGEGR